MSNAYTSNLPEGKDRRWWPSSIDKGERHRVLLPLVERIRANQVWRKEQDLRRMRLYGNAPMVGFGLSSYTRPNTIGGSKVSFNVVKNIADSFTALVTKDRPKVSFVTDEGDWDLQERAKGMERFVFGQFYECDLYNIAPRVVLDGGGIFGTGVLKWYIQDSGENACIRAERVFPWELLIDEQEGIYGTPRSFYQEKWVDRLVLEHMFTGEEKKLEAIRDATRGVDAHNGVGYDPYADQIRVTEAWHLKSGATATDGRHVMAISGGDLEDELWPYDAPPFVFYRKQWSPIGFWGISIADDLDGIQKELNALLMKIQRAMYLLGNPHVLIQNGSKIDRHQIDNDIGSFWSFTGRPPEVYTPPFLVPAETYNHIDRLLTQAYELEGIPRPQAAGETPTETQKSGRSQEVYLQVANRRMKIAVENYHEMFVECATWVLRLGREIVEKHNPKFAVRADFDKRGIKKILMKDHDLKEDEYRLKKWPTNALSEDPSARIADVERLMTAGVIDPDEGKRLLDYPDTQEAMSLANASHDMVEDLISEMLNEGRYMQPPPYLNLAQAKIQVTQALVKAWRQRRAEERLQLLRDFLEELRNLEMPSDQPQAPAMMAGAPGTPQAAKPMPGVTPAMAPGSGPPALPPAAGMTPPPVAA